MTGLTIVNLGQGTAKWAAWNGKKGMSQDKAKEEYVATAKKMMEKHGAR